MSKILLNDGFGGIQSTMKYHTDGMGNEQFTVENTQPTQIVLDSNARMRRQSRENPQKGEMRLVAELPLITVYEWLKEGIDVFDPSPEARNKLRRKLDERDSAYFRTDESKLGQRFF